MFMDVFIKKLEVFGVLTESDKEAIRSIERTPEQCTAKHNITSQGEISPSVQIILSGVACRYKIFSDGRTQIIGFVLPGDLSDINGFLPRKMDHCFGAITNVNYIELSPGDLEMLLSSKSISTCLTLSSISDQEILRAWIANIGQRDAYRRVAYFLCEMHYRFDAVGLCDLGAFDLGVNQDDLGFALGMTTVHINRTLRQLKAAGLVDYKKGNFRILELDKMKRLASFQPDYVFPRFVGAGVQPA